MKHGIELVLGGAGKYGADALGAGGAGGDGKVKLAAGAGYLCSNKGTPSETPAELGPTYSILCIANYLLI